MLVYFEIAGKWQLFTELWLIFNPLTTLVFFGGLGLGTWLVIREL